MTKGKGPNIREFLVVFALLLVPSRALAEDQPTVKIRSAQYKIRYQDRIKIKSIINIQNHWIASYAEAYQYGSNSLSGACLANAADMHVVSATSGVGGSEKSLLWQILPQHGKDDKGTDVIKNGSVVRLQNVVTGRNLHAQACRSIKSPLQMQVSTCLHNGGGDVNADWKIEFVGEEGKEEGKELEVGMLFRLRHSTTGWVLYTNDVLVSESKGDGLEVAAHEESPEYDKPGSYNLWFAEKQMSDPDSDSCAKSTKAEVSSHIDSLIKEITRNYTYAYDNPPLMLQLKKKLDIKKVNDLSKAQSSAMSSSASLAAQAIGIVATYSLVKNATLNDLKIKWPIALLFGIGLTAYNATERVSYEDLMKKQRDSFFEGLSWHKARSTGYDLAGMQASCVMIERNLLSEFGYKEFLTDTTSFFKKGK